MLSSKRPSKLYYVLRNTKQQIAKGEVEYCCFTEDIFSNSPSLLIFWICL